MLPGFNLFTISLASDALFSCPLRMVTLLSNAYFTPHAPRIFSRSSVYFVFGALK